MTLLYTNIFNILFSENTNDATDVIFDAEAGPSTSSLRGTYQT